MFRLASFGTPMKELFMDQNPSLSSCIILTSRRARLCTVQDSSQNRNIDLNDR